MGISLTTFLSVRRDPVLVPCRSPDFKCLVWSVDVCFPVCDLLRSSIAWFAEFQDDRIQFGCGSLICGSLIFWDYARDDARLRDWEMMQELATELCFQVPSVSIWQQWTLATVSALKSFSRATK